MREIKLMIFGVVILLLAGGGIASLALRGALTTNMGDQPSIKPQEHPFEPPPASVPLGKWEKTLSREEAGKVLRNPVPPTLASLQSGQRLYEVYCALCHGSEGKGGGPVAAKFVPPPDITISFFQQRPDGFLYETIRSGGPLMPGQGESLSPKERWDIVNYVRDLQRK
ncbi:MAG: cytochrome c [Deltaproteobacteria bacterium]|nr:cytochrome c [Deltaproteobacteria bacterium]